MLRALSIVLLSAVAAAAQLPNDPWYQVVTLATNDSFPHGTKFIQGASGSNYLAVTTRGGGLVPARVMFFDANNISNYSVISFSTNRYSYAPECVVVSNKLYVMMVGYSGGSSASTNWTITVVDPDTLATNDIVPSNTTFPCSDLGSIATDGTNLFVVNGEYSVGKFAFDGSLIASNYLGAENTGFPLCDWIWKGQNGHALWWDGTNFLITGNGTTCATNTSFIIMAPDLSFTQGRMNGLAFTNGVALKMTDDLCSVGPWAFMGTELDVLGRIHLFNTTTLQHAAVDTGMANSGLCFGTFPEGHYVWATWALGYLSRIDTRTVESPGIVRVDNFTLGEQRPSFNELVVTTNNGTRVYYATSFAAPSQVFRFSQPQLYSVQASTTNGALLNQPTLLVTQ
jgi:hypothetical protein